MIATSSPQTFFQMRVVTNTQEKGDFNLYQDNNAPWALEGGDHVALRIGVADETPPLVTISSNAPSSDGSIAIIDRGVVNVTPALVTITLEPAGANKLPIGTLTGELRVIRGGAELHVCYGQVKVCRGSS